MRRGMWFDLPAPRPRAARGLGGAPGVADAFGGKVIKPRAPRHARSDARPHVAHSPVRRAAGCVRVASAPPDVSRDASACCTPPVRHVAGALAPASTITRRMASTRPRDGRIEVFASDIRRRLLRTPYRRSGAAADRLNLTGASWANRRAAVRAGRPLLPGRPTRTDLRRRTHAAQAPHPTG